MQTIEHQTAHLSAFLLLIKNEKVLFLRRYNTGWRDGWYTLPAGHVDLNEEIAVSMSREATEECGIKVKEEDLDFIHVMHIYTNKDYIAFFFKAEKWEGDPHIVEPEKSDEVGWFPLNDLPEKTLPFIKEMLIDYQKGKYFSEKTYRDDM